MWSIFTRLWYFGKKAIPDDDPVEIMRWGFGYRCPLCGQGLTEHAYADLAFSLLRNTDEAAMRAALVAGPIDALPREPINDATIDALSYFLLKCPIRGAYAVMRHFSAADINSINRLTVVPGIPSQRVEQLANSVSEWTAL